MSDKNVIDAEMLADFIKKIEKKDQEKASLHGKYMQDAGVISRAKAKVLAEAKSQGVDVNILKLKLKERELERRAAALTADLDEEDEQTYEQYTDALGDLANLPLGEAAVQRDKPKGMPGAKAGDSKVVDLKKTH